MAKQPHANYCGAKTRSGRPCKNRAMANGRCRMHGGKSTGPPKGNKNAATHGFFSRIFPNDAETMAIIDAIGQKDPLDIIWENIVIQYTAIARAQRIMFVTNQDDLTKVLKRVKESEASYEREYEIQFAWDKHASFLQAQSRAISTLQSLIRQFDEMANANDERRLKLEQMKLGIEKTRAEVEKIADSDDKPIEIMIKRKGDE